MRNNDPIFTSDRCSRPIRWALPETHGNPRIHYLLGFAFLLVLPALLAACQPAAEAVPDDFAISLERSPCFGTCPVYTMTVSADGNVVFDGQQFVQAEGGQTATLPAAEVTALFNAVESADFFTLQDEYTMEVTDLPSITTTVTRDGQTKSVYHYGLGCDNDGDPAPQGLCDLEALLESIPVANGWVAEN